jgi:F-type H+-transporting ATPase subunit epsilon
MSAPFQVFILAADGPLYEGPCESLVVPMGHGQYGILAHHRDMIGAVVPGTLLYRVPGGELQPAAVSAGMVKVEGDEVLVLVDTAERPEEIDANRARRAADEAKEALLQKRSIQEYHAAQANLSRALSRLRVKHRYGGGS